MGDTISRKPHLAMSSKAFEPPQWRDSLRYNELSICWPVNLTINPEYSLEVLILKVKLQYFGHLMQTADSLEKITKKQCTWSWGQTLAAGEGQGGLACYSPWGHEESDTTCDWTATATKPHKTLDQGKDCVYFIHHCSFRVWPSSWP